MRYNGMSNKEYLSQYRKKRWFGGNWDAVVERDKGCVKCGKVVKLHVHHKDRDRTNNDMSNLETLCLWCHGKHHSTSISVGRYNLEGKLLETYSGMREAARRTGIEYSVIAKTCRGTQSHKTAGGFVWRVL
jgi:hypothetical protein